jgi:hypothetical protein
MSQVRRFTAAGLDEAAPRRAAGGLAIGAIDETGQEKADEATLTCYASVSTGSPACDGPVIRILAVSR